MRVFSAPLQAALDSGASTFARCWRITRNDGVVMGFTDHDLPLSFDGVDYAPETGLTPSAIESGTGLAPDSHAVEGALSSDKITSDDIARGRYTGAEVALFLVDWTDPNTRTLLSRGHIGEIRRGTIAFEAEINGLSAKLNQPTGGAYLHTCTCRLGEPKCGIDLSAAAYRGIGAVAAGSDTIRLNATGLTAFADGWFTGGNLTWMTGANAGTESAVKAHLSAGSEAVIELWIAPPLPLTAGDQFRVTAGCDKTAATCAQRFANLENFRGFPHMPGDDVAASYPSNGGNHDGGSLFRS